MVDRSCSAPLGSAPHEAAVGCGNPCAGPVARTHLHLPPPPVPPRLEPYPVSHAPVLERTQAPGGACRGWGRCVGAAAANGSMHVMYRIIDASCSKVRSGMCSLMCPSTSCNGYAAYTGLSTRAGQCSPAARCCLVHHVNHVRASSAWASEVPLGRHCAPFPANQPLLLAC